MVKNTEQVYYISQIRVSTRVLLYKRQLANVLFKYVC